MLSIMPLRIVLLLVLLVGLTACSYRPLYGGGTNGSSVVAALSQIAVDEQKTRAGQMVRNDLISSLGAGSSGNARYVLHMVPSETTTGVSSNSAQKLTRKRYKLTVKYELTEVKTGKSLTSGASFSNVSFDTVEQPLADLQAADNAQLRAAQEVSEDIRTRLAAFLSAGQT